LATSIQDCISYLHEIHPHRVYAKKASYKITSTVAIAR
jgi:hypothetical protein